MYYLLWVTSSLHRDFLGAVYYFVTDYFTDSNQIKGAYKRSKSVTDNNCWKKILDDT